MAIEKLALVASGSAGELLKGVLSLATVSALVSWFYSRHHKLRSVRANYLAQLETLQNTISREIDFCSSSDHPFSWFPILPYFQGDVGPLSVAGILSNDEVRAITAAYLSYRETLVYLWNYGEPSRASDVIDTAIGIKLEDPRIKRFYLNDLRELQTTVTHSVDVLRNAKYSIYRQLGWIIPVVLFGVIFVMVVHRVK